MKPTCTVSLEYHWSMLTRWEFFFISCQDRIEIIVFRSINILFVSSDEISLADIMDKTTTIENDLKPTLLLGVDEKDMKPAWRCAEKVSRLFISVFWSSMYTKAGWWNEKRERLSSIWLEVRLGFRLLFDGLQQLLGKYSRRITTRNPGAVYVYSYFGDLQVTVLVHNRPRHWSSLDSAFRPPSRQATGGRPL